MKIYAVLFLLVIFKVQISCGQNSVLGDVSNKEILASNSEFLDWKSLKINDQLYFLSKAELLLKLLGNPDSIVVPKHNCVSYYDKVFKLGYLKGFAFEVYSDTAILSSIDIIGRADIKLAFPNVNLDKKTTLMDLNKLFPESVKNHSQIDIIGLGKVIAVQLEISKQPMEDKWILFFKKEVLVRIDYWMPC